MPEFVPMFVRPETKERFERYAKRKRMPLYQGADVLSNAPDVLTSEQESALIERKPDRPRQEKQPA